MHQSFVSTAPSGPGISGAFNFSIFKAPLKALHSGAKIVVKSLLKAPPPGADNSEDNKRPESFELTFLAYSIVIPHKCNRKAMNRNWSNQKSNPALKTKVGNK